MRRVVKKNSIFLFIVALLAGLWYMVWIHGRLFYPRELEGCSVWVYNPEYCEFSDEAMSVDDETIVEQILSYCLELNLDNSVYWVRTAFTLQKSWYCELSAEAFAYMNEIAETYYKEEKVRRY